MMTPQRREEVGVKKVFRAFLVWFLRKRYMSYLVKDGKMEEKDLYIAFKNKFFLYVSKHQENYFDSTKPTGTENGN